MNISIIGAGYLGLTTAAVLANAGFKVYAVDVNEEVINKLKTGKPHFFEPKLEELVSKAVSSGNLIPTLDYSQAIPDSDVSFVCVDTIGLEDGSLSTKSVEAATKSIAQNMKENHVIVIKSTVPAGTHKILKEQVAKVTDTRFHYVSKPEFLAEGSAILDTMLPDRLIIGTDSDFAFETLKSVFAKVDEFGQKQNIEEYGKYAGTYREKFNHTKPFEDRIIRVSVESAELIKVTSNSFLALKISFANMVARLSEKVGGDINQIMDGVGADPRIGRDFLYAGLGWGGGCFPKDVKGLIKSGEDNGCDFSILKEADDLNQDQSIWVISKVREILGEDISDKKVAVLGLAFKPGTDDLRLSPSTKLVGDLSTVVSQVRVFDPKANDNAKEYFKHNAKVWFGNEVEDVFNNADIVILATDWPEFINLDFSNIIPKMNNPVFLDSRNKWDPEIINTAGGEYYGLGR